jgi:multidrug resistance efflux pump
MKQLRIMGVPLLAVVSRAVLAVVLVAIGVGVFAVLQQTAPVPESDPASAALRRVQVMPARPVLAARQFTGYGTAEALHTADVPAPVSGTIVEIPADVLPGAAVRRGQLLVQVDPADYQLRVDAAQRALEALQEQGRQLWLERARVAEQLVLAQRDVALQRAQFARVQELSAGSAASRQDLDRAQSALLTAQQNRSNLRDTYGQLGGDAAAVESAADAADADVDPAEVAGRMDPLVGADPDGLRMDVMSLLAAVIPPEVLPAQVGDPAGEQAVELTTLGVRGRGLMAQIAQQASQLGQAYRELNKARIVSPLDGVVQEIGVEVGEAVSPGAVVARVVDPTVIEVPVRLPGVAQTVVTVGDPLWLTSRSSPGSVWRTTIARVAPAQDGGTRTLTVYGVLEQPGVDGELPAGASMGDVAGGRLSPGMFVQGAVASGQRAERWLVPRRAIQDGRLRLVDADGRVGSVPVRVSWTLRARVPGLGLDDEQWAVLAEPLEPGQRVLVNASSTVLDGEQVQPVVAEQAEGALEAVPVAGGGS